MRSGTLACEQVEAGETKKPGVNGTTVYLWWKRFYEEIRWHSTTNAPAGRSSKIACNSSELARQNRRVLPVSAAMGYKSAQNGRL